MSEGAHQHRFKTYKTRDFCHYQQLCQQCEDEDCLLPTQQLVRRDFSDGTQRMAWARPDECSTCRRMLSELPASTWSQTL